MFRRIVFSATLAAMLAAVVVMPSIGLAEESGPRPPRASHESPKPHGERVRDGQERGRPGRDHDVNRPEIRRCIEAVREHGGNRDDLRRCLAEARDNETSRSELRRCIAAVREHNGDREDLRRCLADAWGDEITRPEVRRCIEAAREHGGNRDDLRRCLAHAHEGDPRPASTAGLSLPGRTPEPASVPGAI